MKTIYLHGVLAKKFGRIFKLDVKTPREAAHAIACQLPSFAKFMIESESKGMKFAVFNGKKRTKETNIGEDKLDFCTDSNIIHIVPHIMGGGGKGLGWLQVIGGIAMIGFGIAFQQPGLIGAGVGMLVGGVATLLMPTPKIDGMDEDGNRPSNGFGGAITTTNQGHPIALLYGERDCGGAVGSFEIIASDKTVAGAVVSPDIAQATKQLFRR